jgi:hypothetical protein
LQFRPEQVGPEEPVRELQSEQRAPLRLELQFQQLSAMALV